MFGPVFATEKFVFLHVPKTGGSFVRKVFEDQVVYEAEHQLVCDMPTEFRHLPRFALVRNPWDWYVSWWAFMNEVRDGNPFWAEIRGENFEETLRHAHGIDVEELNVYEPIKQGWPLYDWWWAVTVEAGRNNGLPVDVGRFETLADSLCGFLARHALLDDELEQRIRSSERVNASEHAHYRGFYSPAARELVRQRSNIVVRRYRYEF
jgi:hypothetical protein